MPKYKNKSLFLLVFFAILTSFISIEETAVRTHEDEVVNIYVKDPNRLTCLRQPLLSPLHAKLLQSVKSLGQSDNYEVNHLFAQFLYVCENNAEIFVVQKNLCWNGEEQTVSFQEGLDGYPIINFISRKSRSTAGEISFYAMNASEDESLHLNHSEFLLLKILKENSQSFIDFLPKNGCKLLHCGIILYSSIDSCDLCQNQLLQFFGPSSDFIKELNTSAPHTMDIPWFICYFSTVPCKKSTYNMFLNGELLSFFYDKKCKTFYFKDDPLKEWIFPCKIEEVDIGNFSKPLIFLSHFE